jgi:heme exporter protein C
MEKKLSESAHAALALVWFFVALYMIFLFAPREETMGEVQRIFYIHVPSAITAFTAYFVVAVGSILYLAKRKPFWDELAHSAAEVGFIFCSCVLVTGPLWAKPVWGIWWTWDMRLTSTFILWLLFISYLMLRSYLVNPARAATLSAVVGVIGAADVIFDYMSIRWFRTQHPQPAGRVRASIRGCWQPCWSAWGRFCASSLF